MMQQEIDFTPRDSHLSSVEYPRLRGQNKSVYEALQGGPKSTLDLMKISLRPAARIFDLKEAGIQIETKYDPKTGCCIYSLISER